MLQVYSSHFPDIWIYNLEMQVCTRCKQSPIGCILYSTNLNINTYQQNITGGLLDLNGSTMDSIAGLFLVTLAFPVGKQTYVVTGICTHSSVEKCVYSTLIVVF